LLGLIGYGVSGIYKNEFNYPDGSSHKNVIDLAEVKKICEYVN